MAGNKTSNHMTACQPNVATTGAVNKLNVADPIIIVSEYIDVYTPTLCEKYDATNVGIKTFKCAIPAPTRTVPISIVGIVTTKRNAVPKKIDANDNPNAFFKPKNAIVFDAKLEISRNITNGIVVKIPSCPLLTPNSPEICVNIKGSVVMGDRIIKPIKRTLAAKIAPVDATFLLLILTLLSKT